MSEPKMEIMLRVAEMNMESCATGKFVTIEQFADGMMEVYKDLTAERDRYREFVEHVLVATMDGTYAQLDTPAILDQLQCSAAEAVGEERFGELFNALNREE